MKKVTFPLYARRRIPFKLFLFTFSLLILSLPEVCAIDDPEKIEEIVAIEREITREKEAALIDHFYEEARNLMRDEKYEEAIDQFARILEVEPDHRGAKRGIKRIKEILREKKEKQSPQLLAMRLVRSGRSKYAEKDYEGAIEDFQDALVLDYKNQDALDWLKRTRRIMNLRDYDDTEDDLSREAEMATRDKQIHEKKAMIEVERAYLPPERTETPAKELAEDVMEFEEDEDAKLRQALMADLKKRMVPAISLVEADVRDVIRELMEITGITIVIDEGALREMAGEDPLRITLNTVNPLPLMDVLDIALKATDLDYKVQTTYIWVSTPEKLKREELVTRTYTLRFGVRRVRKVGLKEFVTHTSN